MFTRFQQAILLEMIEEAIEIEQEGLRYNQNATDHEAKFGTDEERLAALIDLRQKISANNGDK